MIIGIIKKSISNIVHFCNIFIYLIVHTCYIYIKEIPMDCKYFDGCSAPLCPRDEGMADRAWFPDEDICRLADVPAWVKRQRKIAKMGLPFEAGYFTRACSHLS
jgi:hypothetical protein